MIAAACAAGLDAIVFAEHDRLVGREHLAMLNAKYAPFKIFTGIEIALDGEHVVVIGIDNPLLETHPWRWDELCQFVEKNNGFAFLAHPYRWHDDVGIDIENHPPGAVEIFSSNMGECDRELVESLAARPTIRPIANSDAHAAELVGLYYNELAANPANDGELVEALKSGAFQPRRNTDAIESLKAVEGIVLP